MNDDSLEEAPTMTGERSTGPHLATAARAGAPGMPLPVAERRP